MPSDADEFDQSAVVLLGRFQVADMNPRELLRKEILTPADAEQLRVTTLLPNDLLAFETQFLGVTVEQNKLTVTTRPSAPIPEKARDFVTMVLADQEGSMLALGINRDVHFHVKRAESYLALRDKLIQLAPWGSVLRNPLLKGLVLQSERYDGHAGQINVRIEPSVLITQGVFVAVNDRKCFG
jgi:hypothetical protein